MNENINSYEDKKQIIKIEENNYKTNIPQTNLFVSKKLNTSNKDKRQKTKKYIKFISFKKPYFKVKNKKDFSDLNINRGRWSEEEKNNFIKGIFLYGTKWKKINSLIPSRTAIQVRSHAQKIYQKMKLCKDENLGIDFTLKSINNIKNIINQIKSKYPNYNNIYIFKKLLNDCVKRRFLKKKKKNKIYKIDNNLPKNEDKNELIKFDEINNNLINNLTFNQNNQNDKYMKSFENNNIN